MKYKNYRNSKTNDNRIYTNKDIKNMTLSEIFKHKEEILAQNRAIGVPSESELRGSENVVYVHAYAREDGTHVKAHWRSKSGSAEQKQDMQNKSQIDEAKNNEETVLEFQQMENKKVQTQEKFDKQLYPDEIAGVKRTKAMTKEEAGAYNVNPGYYSGDKGYMLNCASCVPVHKAREMGYNIEALPARSDDDGEVKMLRHFPYYAYEAKDGGEIEAPKKFRFDDKEDCIKKLQSEIKEGECYEFWYHVNGTEDSLAHTVEISKNDKGQIEIYDPQSGNTYDTEYFEKMDYVKTENGIKQYYPQYIFRIDDKKLKYNLLNKISKPAHRNSI